MPNGGLARELTFGAAVVLDNVAIGRKVDVAGGGVTIAAAFSGSSGPVGAGRASGHGLSERAAGQQSEHGYRTCRDLV